MMVDCVQPLPAVPMMTTVTSTIGKKRLFIKSSPCIFGSDALGNSHAPVTMNVVPWNITKRLICSGWSGSGGSISMVRMPQTEALLKRPSGTPLRGTAPGTSGSALTLRRWKSGSGSLIVSRRRPRIWISAVMRWDGGHTSTFGHAPVVTQIRSHGCVVVGKANLHEFAFGVTSVNPHYGPVRNPHDPSRVAGGSSGGSAVAVAAGMCDWAIGSDTGGSIRIPASLCGVAGFKPAFGSIGIGGVIPLSKSLDTLGPMAPDLAPPARAHSLLSGESISVHPLSRPRLARPR